MDSGASQHMASAESGLVNVVDVSNLDLKVDHPNGSTARINKIGNMPFSESLTLFDVLVVPEFSVNLLSVHKLCRHRKCDVIFNEYSCSVQGSQSKETVGTGSESGGLYYYNSSNTGKNKSFLSIVKCYVSKHVWHNRLGHPGDQALVVLKDRLQFSNGPLPPL